MRRWLVTALIVFAAAAALAQEGGAPPTRDEFVRLATEAIRKAGETRPITYDAKEFCLVGEGGGRLYLGGFFDECLAARDAAGRAAILDRMARLWARPELAGGAFADVRAALLPAVRERAALEFLRFRVPSNAKGEFPWRPIGEHFGVALVVDAEETMTWVGDEKLREWGISLEKALEIATTNLRARDAKAPGFGRVAPGLYVSTWADSYDSSRLLLPDALRKLDVDGDPVVALPNRETLIVTGARDGPGLTKLAELARAALERPRPMNGRLLRLEGETWRPFLPDRASAAFAALRRLEVEAQLAEHREQKELLEARLAAEGKDIFVASLGAKLDTGTGEVRTHCVWTRGADSLLPRADVVVFMDVDGPEPEMVGAATWERVAEVAGDLLVPERGLYPARYRARRFPTEAQLAKIGKDAAPPR